MHFITMVAVDIKKYPIYEDDDISIQERIKELEQIKASIKKNNDSIFKAVSIGCEIRYLKSIANSFARAVDQAVEEELEPFCEQTENPKYLEFSDETEELRSRYDTSLYDCVRLANGKIVLFYDIKDDFCIKDGVIYQKNVGQLKLEKRTKKAKKMKLLPNYPLKKLYKTFEDCAENFFDMEYNEEHQGYGYMINFNSFWDWYRIGGRWPCAFLVKDDCTEYSEGNHDEGVMPTPPKGYKWACAARKKDIQWQALIAYKKERTEREFRIMSEAFRKKELPENSCWLSLCANGIFTYGGDALYLDGETFEENLQRRSLVHDSDYLAMADYYVGDGQWQSEDTIPYVEGIAGTTAWRNAIAEFYHSLSDDVVLVSVDCHI